MTYGLTTSSPGIALARNLRVALAFAVAVAVLLLGGCASLPSPEAMRAATAGFELPKQPAAGEAMVYVVRPSMGGGIVRFNVFIDSKDDAAEVGFTRGNQHIYFVLAPGARTIYSKAENWAEIALTVQPGEVAFIEQHPAFGFLFARNSLARIDDVAGRYHMKNTEIGTLHQAAPAK